MPSSPFISEPDRATLDAHPDLILVEFGASWCGHCLAAAPHIQAALAKFPQIQHLRIEDGRGQRLGRSFSVKLWPTLILLERGQELGRLVRPTHSDAIVELLGAVQRSR